jgi:hypothetical protein
VKLLFEASAPVRAGIDEVRALIDSEWVLGPLLPGEARGYVDVDHTPGVVGVQGHWWYRGEISAQEHDGGTRLVQRVFNIAGRSAWAVPLANRFFVGFREQLQRGTDDLARRIEGHLGTA